jgi:hypothetical protein
MYYFCHPFHLFGTSLDVILGQIKISGLFKTNSNSKSAYDGNEARKSRLHDPYKNFYVRVFVYYG